MCRGQTRSNAGGVKVEAPKAPSWVGGPSLAGPGVGGSVMSSPNEVRGEAQAINAFSAYSCLF